MKHLFELHLERSLYTGRETKRFVTSSARVAAQMQGIYGTDGERFHILPPPVETQLFKPADNRANVRELLCRKLQTDTTRPVLLLGFMLYHPQQSQELAARIQEALNLDETQREALSQAARETVVALTWEKHPAEWAALLG